MIYFFNYIAKICKAPFKGNTEEEIFDSILHDEILYPVNMPKDAVSLLQKVKFKIPI
jgi:hypothetical protein